jgi:hypothetical protein
MLAGESWPSARMPHPTKRVGVSGIWVAVATTVIAPSLGWIACTELLLGSDVARAETSREFWPEFNAFLKLNERTDARVSSRDDLPDRHGRRPRWGLEQPDTRHARRTPGLFADTGPATRPARSGLGTQSLPVGRVGYQYSSSLNDADSDTGFRENRGVFQVTGRTPPLAGDLEWIARVRWDLRDRSDTPVLSLAPTVRAVAWPAPGSPRRPCVRRRPLLDDLVQRKLDDVLGARGLEPRDQPPHEALVDDGVDGVPALRLQHRDRRALQ